MALQCGAVSNQNEYSLGHTRSVAWILRRPNFRQVLICFYVIASKCTKTPKRLNGWRFNVALQLQPMYSTIMTTHQFIYEIYHGFFDGKHLRLVQICLFTIDSKYNGTLEAAHCYSDNVWYDKALQCGAASYQNEYSSGHLRDCSLGSTNANLSSRANMLLSYRHQIYYHFRGSSLLQWRRLKVLQCCSDTSTSNNIELIISENLRGCSLNATTATLSSSANMLLCHRQQVK